MKLEVFLITILIIVEIPGNKTTTLPAPTTTTTPATTTTTTPATTTITTPSPYTTTPSGPYYPSWDSIDQRPLPNWYDNVKIGIFIHWGVYSVPSFTSEWFWINWKGNPSPSKSQQEKIEQFMKQNYKPGFSYQDFAKDFTAEFFNATEWANLIEQSGAKYVVLTSKHHDGYALWPSTYSFGWNSMDIGPHKDIIGELSTAIRKKEKIHFGLYHSLYEWFNPLYLQDKASNFNTQDFVNNKIFPEMKELVQNYQPDVFWSDGEWEAESSYWRSEEFLTWLYDKSPVKDSVVVNDRWGRNTLCTHGGVYTCADRYNPGKLLDHKWENAMTIDKTTWGFNRKSNIENYLTSAELIQTLVEAIAFGGNILINVGPSKDGTISPIFQERLLDMGKWLAVNGEAIYGSQPWQVCQNDSLATKVWYTTKESDLYVIMLKWPKSGTLYLNCPQISDNTIVTMLELKSPKLPVTTTEKRLVKILLPLKSEVKLEWGWVLKLSNIVNKNKVL